MRRFRQCVAVTFGVLVVAAAAAPGAALAISWSPIGTNVGALTGVVTLTTNTGARVRCTYSSYLKAAGSIANTTNSSGTFTGPVWSGCSNTISSGLSTSISSPTAWNYHAIATTTADISSINMGITIGGGLCTIRVSGTTVRGHPWSNASHALTLNSGVSFVITESGLCDGGTTGRLSGTIVDTSSTLSIF